jgi:hypothetical protein
MVAASAADAATLTWSGPQLIEHQPPFTNSPPLRDIACPTVRFCVSTTLGGPDGVSGIEVSHDPTGGPAAWRYERFATPGMLESDPLGASCPSLRLCVVLVDAGAGASPYVISSATPERGTGHWHVRPAPSGMTSLACPTRKLCIGTTPSSIEITRHPREGARAWRAVNFKSLFFPGSGIACHGAHLCVAVGVLARGAAVAVTTDPTGGRRAWHVTDLPLGRRIRADTTAAACPSTDACVITDLAGHVIASRDPAAPHPRWRVSVVPGAGESLSCPSPSFCASASAGAVASSHNPTGGRAAWSSTPWPSPRQESPALACPSARLCLGAGPDNEVLVSTAPSRGASTFTTTQLDQGVTPITTIACPSAALCLADGEDGRLLRSSSPAGGPGTWSPLASNVQTELLDLSCSSVDFCAGLAGGFVVTGDPSPTPLTWTQAPVDAGTDAVSCASEAFCAAGDVGGHVLTTTNPAGGAGTWTATQLPTPPDCNEPHGICVNSPLTGIACPTATFCAAIDDQGGYWRSSNPGGGASTWTDTRLPLPSAEAPQVTHLDCPGASLCVAVTPTHVLTTSDPADPAPTWTTVTLPPAPGPVTVPASIDLSCASSNLCVAVNRGWAMWGDPMTGGSWSAVQIDGSTPLTAVSCASSGFCVAGDSAGRVFTAQSS